MIDLLIVGSGLTGATIAHLAAQEGYTILILEARENVGGNLRDNMHFSGIRYGLYGPHYFRTSSPSIWKFVNQFVEFAPFAAKVKTHISGELRDWPITNDYLRANFGRNWRSQFVGFLGCQPRNFEEACIAKLPWGVYENFIQGYTAKQWGCDPRELDVSLANRFAIREGSDRRLKLSRYQGIPKEGYISFIRKMLARVDQICCDTDYYEVSNMAAKITIHTGAIDRFFDYKFGKLRYRAQRRVHDYSAYNVVRQPVVQINYPGDEEYIRSIEWRHLPQMLTPIGSLITREYPYSPDDPNEYEYPFPSERDRNLYQRYADHAVTAAPNVIFAGRLGEFKYYDMDQAIARAKQIWLKKIRPRLNLA